MLRILIILNTLFEFGVAVSAAVLLDEPILAGNALGLGTLSLLLINERDPRRLRPGLIAFAVFHSAVLIAWIIDSLQQGAFNPAAAGHALFALGFISAVWANLRQTSVRRTA